MADAYKSLELARTAWEIATGGEAQEQGGDGNAPLARGVLKPGGSLVMKLLQGVGEPRSCNSHLGWRESLLDMAHAWERAWATGALILLLTEVPSFLPRCPLRSPYHRPPTHPTRHPRIRSRVVSRLCKGACPSSHPHPPHTPTHPPACPLIYLLPGTQEFAAELRRDFAKVAWHRCKATRSESKEIFLLGLKRK